MPFVKTTYQDAAIFAATFIGNLTGRSKLFPEKYHQELRFPELCFEIIQA